ncbi:MAG: GxxExxY protein [Geobacteraceae bacterium]|nr:GxxExxY protein [Geobacteraceae bacterium]
MGELIYREEVFQIIGAAIEVHKVLGSGFLEAVYQEALEYELSLRKIPSISQQPLKIQYKTHVLNKEYIADLICFNSIVVELKALQKLTGHEESQVINYLKATGMRVALLINFGSLGKLEWKRLVL